MSNGYVGWDYEDTASPPHYLVYGDGPFDGEQGCIVLAIHVPETPENDADVQCIVDALNRLAVRSPWYRG